MRALKAAFVAALALGVGGCLPGGDRVDVQVEPRGGPSFLVTYSGLTGAPRLDLGPKDPARQGAWTVATAGVVLRSEGGRDVLAPAVAAASLPASVAVRIIAEPMPARTAAIARFGAAGGLVRVARIAPHTDGMRARVAVATAKGYDVYESVDRAPALLLAGAADAKTVAGAVVVFGAGTPGWIRAETESFAARLLPALDARTGRAVKPAPQVFLAQSDADGPPGVETAAAEGQIALELEGAGWRDASPDTAELLHRTAASELARYWLAAAGAATSGWIGDGLADALADEALVAAGVWTQEDADAVLARLHVDCAAALGEARFEDVARNAVAARPCAHAFARAAAGQKGVGAFARDLARQAKDGRPDAASFLKVAGRHAGAHNAALMRTLMTAEGREAADALSALRLSEADDAARLRP